MIKSLLCFAGCLHLLLIGALAQITPDIIEYEHGVVAWTNVNPDLYYTVEWQSSITNDDWKASYRGLQDVQSTNAFITVPVPQFFRISGRTNPAVTRALSSSGTILEAGYYEETDLADIDPALAPENIKSGVTIFGIEGTYEPASPPSADLTEAQVESLAKWADGLIRVGWFADYISGGSVEAETVGTKSRAFNVNWATVASFTPLPRGGLINTEFKIRVNSVFQSGTVEAQIRVNGVPAGTIHATSAESNVTFSDSSRTVSAGDVLSLSIRHSASDVGSVTSDLKILVSNPTSSNPSLLSGPVDADSDPFL